MVSLRQQEFTGKCTLREEARARLKRERECKLLKTKTISKSSDEWEDESSQDDHDDNDMSSDFEERSHVKKGILGKRRKGPSIRTTKIMKRTSSSSLEGSKAMVLKAATLHPKERNEVLVRVQSKSKLIAKEAAGSKGAKKHIRPKGKTASTAVVTGREMETNINIQSTTAAVLDATPKKSRRFKEPMLQLYSEILTWDIHAAYYSKDAHYSDKREEMSEENIQVPSRFSSYAEYYDVWQPLAVKEIAAQTLNCLSVQVRASMIKCSWDKISKAPFVDLSMRFATRVEGNIGRPPDIIVHDYVLLTCDVGFFLQTKNDSDKKEKVVAPYALGVVISQGSSIKMKVWTDSVRAVEAEKKDIHLFKLSNLISSMREFTALVKCSNYKLFPLLLSGEHQPGSLKLDTLGAHYVQWLTDHFNDSQLAAIKYAATSSGFTLIKGPPGTGKTTTLKGLLNSLHLREYSRYYNAILNVAKKSDEETAQAWAAMGNEKPHILVTAPSNIAVDNIVSKIMEEGFCDGNGRRYNPSIVRIGKGKTDAVYAVSLDAHMEKIMKKTIDEIDSTLWRLKSERQQVEADSRGIRVELRKFVEWFKKSRSSPLPPDSPVNQNTIFSPINSQDETPLPPPDSPQLNTPETPPCPPSESNSPMPPSPPTIDSDDSTLADAIIPPVLKKSNSMTEDDFPAYNQLAQRINACLERQQQIILEIERYEFIGNEKRKDVRNIKSCRDYLETSFLREAHIVFTTLSSAGMKALDDTLKFEVIVVDEAAQSVELSNIIPLRFGSSQCVLVGDPQQLSATTFQTQTSHSLYERSLFERLESCGHPVHLLSVQYRSHPKISQFPREYFYDGAVTDGENVLKEVYTRPYHSLGPAFAPLVFFNLPQSVESKSGTSRCNVLESELALNLYLTLKQASLPSDIVGKVGVITPYTEQKRELQRQFYQKLGSNYTSEVEINTVDGFQGREKDIIILSTVRADKTKGVGFLNDIRRMNVALTRAKFACYVVGCEAALATSRPWKAFLDHVWRMDCVIQVVDPNVNLLTVREARLQDRYGSRRGSPAPRQRSHERTRSHERPQYNQDRNDMTNQERRISPRDRFQHQRGRGNQARGNQGRGDHSRGRGNPNRYQQVQQHLMEGNGNLSNERYPRRRVSPGRGNTHQGRGGRGNLNYQGTNYAPYEPHQHLH